MNDRPTQEEVIFEQAVKCASAEERAAFLGEACCGSAELRVGLELLLEGRFKADGFLATEPQPHRGSPDEAMGHTLGHYKLLENVGEDGCGVVYIVEE